MTRGVTSMFSSVFSQIFIKNTKDKLKRFVGIKKSEAKEKGFFKTFTDTAQGHYQRNTQGTWSF